jgi:hypothetical protein
MNNKHTQRALSDIARTHEHHAATTQLNHDTDVLTQRSQRLEAATTLLLRAKKEDVDTTEWDALVADWNEGDFHAIQRVFPREEWPEGVVYGNSVAYGIRQRERYHL